MASTGRLQPAVGQLRGMARGGQIWVTTAYQQYHSGCSCRTSRIKGRLNYKSAACGASGDLQPEYDTSHAFLFMLLWKQHLILFSLIILDLSHLREKS